MQPIRLISWRMLSLHWRPLPISISNSSNGTSWNASLSATNHRTRILLTETQSSVNYFTQNMILLPIAIDPHGRWGPMTENFLNLTSNPLTYTFLSNRPNAFTMFKRATTSPSPIGILKSADSIWKATKQRHFFGHSYTSPTPTIFTLQKLGLGITKAFALHIRNATQNWLFHIHRILVPA